MLAQSSNAASGGKASGTVGSVSYTAGQIVYTTNNGTNGIASQGVQQPYEFSVPQMMSYQAVIRDASSKLIKSLPVGMRISILQGSVSGAIVYSETQIPVTNINGLVSIEIGGGTGFNTIDWSNGSYFIKDEMLLMMLDGITH